MRKYLLATACFVCVLAACSVQPESEGWKGNYEETINEISVSVAPFNMDGVKSSLSPSGKFSWQTDDKIAFIPQDSDAPFGVQQSMFYVETGGSSAASFKAVGWGLLIGNQYFSYYPYSDTATAESVTVDYTGQRQTSAGNTEHLGKYDYLHAYTDPIAVESKKDVEYKHLGGIAQFNIDLSEIDGYSSKHFTKLTLECSGNVIAESASYNPSVANAAISSGGKTLVSALDIALGSDDSGLTCSSNILDVYAMMCPTEWLGKTITARLTDTENKIYDGDFTPKSNLGAGEGKFYKIKATDPNAVVDLAKNGSANCYIVQNGVEKTYSFPLVRGNSTTAVDGVTKVKVMWESENTTTAPAQKSIIKEVSIKDGKIQFTATGTPGNALIIAYDNGPGDQLDPLFKEGYIKWSWHIWCPEGMPADDTYGSFKLMDRNLGALNNTPGSVGSKGLLYQWGRKDPFLGGTTFDNSNSSRAEARTFDNESNKIHNRTAGGETLPYETEKNYPTVFFYSPASQKWCSDFNTNYWAATKTVNDPCPPGYRIPDRGDSQGLNITFGNRVGEFGTCQGCYLKGSDGTPHFWPMTGTYIDGTGSGQTAGDYWYPSSTAQYWTVDAGPFAPEGSYVGYTINFSWTVKETPTAQPYSPSYVTAGNPVRCQKIQ